MTPLTLVQYLLGGREAILRVARSRWSVWIGALFVLSAGLAREYDGEDLLHEPWHLAIPFAASLATSLLLYALLRALAKQPEGDVLPYRAFLGLYWMTAPLAWLYAIPVEGWLSPLEATRVNLWLLGLVSVWRVALLVRVLSVVTPTRPWIAMMPVLLFADAVALAALFLAPGPGPMIEFMAGLRSEAEELLLDVKNYICILGFLSLPVWLVGLAIGWRRIRLEAQAPDAAAGDQGLPWLFWFALACVIAWTPALLASQPQQVLRHRVERLYAAGDHAAAIRLMSEHAREDFPPYWSPPPDWGPDATYARHVEMIQLSLEPSTADWVRQEYYRHLERLLELLDYPWVMNPTDEEFRMLVATIRRVPHRADLASAYWEPLQNVASRDDISAETRAELQELLDLAAEDQQ